MTLYDLIIQAKAIQNIVTTSHFPLKINDEDRNFELELRMDENGNPECNLMIE